MKATITNNYNLRFNMINSLNKVFLSIVTTTTIVNKSSCSNSGQQTAAL